jgi:hypothetical protein
MIKELLTRISNNILSALPELQKGIFLARIDEEGRVLIQSDPTKNEFDYSGIKDNEGFYFYIRHRDSGEIRFEESSSSRFSSCAVQLRNTTFELRLVVCFEGSCQYVMEEKLRRALVQSNLLNCGDVRNAKVVPVRSQIDSIAVLKEESPKPRPFNKNLLFVAIDFDLSFDNYYF